MESHVEVPNTVIEDEFIKPAVSKVRGLTPMFGPLDPEAAPRAIEIFVEGLVEYMATEGIVFAKRVEA